MGVRMCGCAGGDYYRLWRYLLSDIFSSSYFPVKSCAVYSNKCLTHKMDVPIRDVGISASALRDLLSKL